MKMSKLLALALVLLISVGTLAGSTIAWFTDEVKSANNIIQSGTLDVDVYRGDPVAKDSVQNDATLFNGVKLWEPGAVAWENLTVVNKGSLAFKYEMTVNGINENKMTDGTEACLSQILQVGYVDGGIAAGAKREEVLAGVKEWKSFAAFKEEGILLPVENDHIKAENKLVDGKAIPVGEKTYGMVICWQPTDEDNKWNVNNGKETDDQKPYLHIDLGINLKASQFTAESDSFDHMYDEDVESPIYPTFSTVKEAMDYFAELEEQVTATIPVRNDEENLDTTLSVKEDDELIIDLKGHKLTVQNAVEKDCIVVNSGAKLTITDSVGGGELHLLTTGNGNNEIYVENTVEGKTATLNITGDAKIVLPGDSDESNMIVAWAEKGDAVVNLKDTASIDINGSGTSNGVLLDKATMNMEDKSSICLKDSGELSTGIFANDSVVTLTDESQIKVTATGFAPCGIYLVENSKGYIKEYAHIYVEGNNYQTGVCIGDATVDMSGGSVTAVYKGDDQANGVFGVLLEQSDAVFNMSGGVITVDGQHCASGICVQKYIAPSMNITGGTFYVKGQLDSDIGYNTAIETYGYAKLNLSGAKFYVNVSRDESSKILGTAALISKYAPISIGEGVEVNIMNSKNNLAFCDYNCKLDFSLVPMKDMVNASSSNGDSFTDRLNGNVPFLVKNVQLNNDNYSSIFDGMIAWN